VEQTEKREITFVDSAAKRYRRIHSTVNAVLKSCRMIISAITAERLLLAWKRVTRIPGMTQGMKVETVIWVADSHHSQKVFHLSRWASLNR
jgi:hypothetical protein